MFNFGVRYAAKTFNKSIKPGNLLQKRKYLTAKQYEEQVPEHLKQALDKADLKTQPKGSPVCDSVASSNRNKLGKELSKTTGAKPGARRDDHCFDESNIKRVEKGIPAKVHGTGLGTPASEWKNNHAVTVVGRTKDGKKMIIHDPDTTHHPKTQAAHENGSNEVRHDLRIVSDDVLKNAGRHVKDGNIMPITEQPVDKTQGLFQRWFK